MRKIESDPIFRVSLSVILLATAAWHPGDTCAQAYPNKPIRVIVPASPGDSCDVLSRLVGQKVSERLGQPLTVDNRPGASGQLGMTMIAQSAPDGYTLGCGQGGNMVIVPLAYQKVPYDTFKDFAPVALMVSNFVALVVHPSVPFKSVKDLVTYAKANPGKLTFATNGEGAFIHFSTEMLRTKAGFTYLHVPYKSVSSILSEIMGGRIDAVIASFISLHPHIVAGRVRLLGIARATRAPNYPDYPTIAESVPGYESGGWFGFVAPAGTSREIIILLNREINRAMTLPDVREKLTAFGLEIHTESPEFFTDTLRRDFEKWGKVVRDIGFKPR